MLFHIFWSKTRNNPALRPSAAFYLKDPPFTDNYFYDFWM